MKEGETVWIKCQDIYCYSEISKISSFNSYLVLDLLPIIGYCTYVVIKKNNNLDDCVCASIYFNNDWHKGKIAYDFKKLL